MSLNSSWTVLHPVVGVIWSQNSLVSAGFDVTGTGLQAWKLLLGVPGSQSHTFQVACCNEYVVKITFFCESMLVVSLVSGLGVDGDGIT